MYQVNRISPVGLVKFIAMFASFNEAYDFCCSKDWTYTDLSGMEWELKIQEL